MPERGHPATESVEAGDGRQNWVEVLDQVARNKTRVIVEESGTPIAALLSADDFERLARLEAERETRGAVIERAREAFKDVPDEELAAQVDKADAEAHAQLRVERVQAAGRP